MMHYDINFHVWKNNIMISLNMIKFSLTSSTYKCL